jgi:DNA-directed RNA polymerase omega subunit
MLSSKALSRGPDVDTEACVRNAGGNRFDLVLIAAVRTREIRKQQSHSDKREHVFPLVTALQDVESGKVGPEYLKRVR